MVTGILEKLFFLSQFVTVLHRRIYQYLTVKVYSRLCFERCHRQFIHLC